MATVVVPDVVRSTARANGADDWLAELPELVDRLEREWDLTVGEPYPDATEAYVAAATLADGSPAVLKLLIRRGHGRHSGEELTVLRLAGGDGCVRLLRHDEDSGAMLLERLGPSMYRLGLPIEERHEILCRVAMRLWRPAPGSGLRTGAEKARSLIRYVEGAWDRLGRPCSEAAVAQALAAAERRAAAHDDERAVLLHGDVHQWNTLRAGPGDWKLVDPDGVLGEPEGDLGVLMREDPEELIRGDPRDRAHWLAARTGTDPVAIWEWGNVERLANGLYGLETELAAHGRASLAASDVVAGLTL
ncbi:MAG TPA: aminoglycoside phosphotransferase family protein [Mycobacteriales bacterium]|nr:aminoglycoside phosphotransferase family protein [Mycobacteriales bacterium]